MDLECIRKELVFKAVGSGGPGGQHANKTATKAELMLNIPASQGLSEQEKERILGRLKNHINKAGFLIITDASSRSQLKNREAAFEKMTHLLENAIKIRKPRKKTKPSRKAKEERLKKKRQQAEKKSKRQKPDLD